MHIDILRKVPRAWRAPLLRVLSHFIPSFRGTGARIEWIAPNLQSVRLRLPFNWRTRNLVGSIFGGSICAATDGVHATFLLLALGARYVVWDKSVMVDFRRPARTTLYAEIAMSKEEIEHIRQTVRNEGEMRCDFSTSLCDQTGVVYSVITRTVYVADKDFYRNKRDPR